MGRRKRNKPLPDRREPRDRQVIEPSQQPRVSECRERSYLTAGICAAILLAVGLVFAQTAQFDFVNYDDNEYVYENTPVIDGLTKTGVVWAFTVSHASNWHPLTWLSHMLDCQLYGLTAGGHHVTNVLLHGANAVLLFLVLRRMTGRLWPSALVAIVFAIHPLRAESVAWVSERKDVLSGLFFMLTLAAYVGYARRSFSLVRYAAIALLLAIGLMAKPMLVTLPCVLLLLDYWPLERWKPIATDLSDTGRRFRIPWKLILEKLPLLLLVAISCVVTRWAQRGAIISVDAVSIGPRVGNAMLSYVRYIGQMFWPTNLAVFYPYSMIDASSWNAVVAAVFLVGVSIMIFVLRRRLPYLFVGWFWYLGMMVPVIGLVQVGAQSMADRYTYLPQIGLYIAVVWGVADLAHIFPRLRRPVQAIAVLLVLVLMGCAWRQTTYWRNNMTLWNRALGCTSVNVLAHNNLGNALLEAGEIPAAIEHYNAALEIKPEFVWSYNNLGTIHAQRGETAAAIAYFEKAIKYAPDYVDARVNLGNALASQGLTAPAIEHLRTAIRLQPNSFQAYCNLGNALLAANDLDASIEAYRTAMQLNPRNVEIHNNLAVALQRQGNMKAALDQWREVVRLQPSRLAVINPLAWALATHPDANVRNGSEAIRYAEVAVRATKESEPGPLSTLAAAYAEAGRFPEAVGTARQAERRAMEHGQTAMAEGIRGMISLYEAKKPFRQQARPTIPPPPARSTIPPPPP